MQPDTLALARTHSHERDSRILFDAVTHKYFIDGMQYPSSVSGLIHEYFPHFDATATINTYYCSWKSKKDHKYYPLIQYLTGVIKLDDDAAKCEIARNWGVSGAAASNLGTDVHFQIEMALNGEAHISSTPEFQQYQEWKATHPDWKPYRTEYSVFDEGTLVCGQIDSLWQDGKGNIHMVRCAPHAKSACDPDMVPLPFAVRLEARRGHEDGGISQRVGLPATG